MGDPGVLRRYRLIIFDADDTLRRTTVPGKPCPHAPGEWELMPGVRDLLGTITWNRDGSPRLGIASNQDQVAYGHLSLTMARRLLRDLARSAADCEPAEPALQLCPHGLEVECACRKPQPGMLIAIMRYYGIDPADTLYVGNHEVDQEAAARAGTAFCWSHELFN